MEVGTEIPKPEVLKTNDELCRFLLPNSWNAQSLSGLKLSREVEIVGVQANRHPEAWLQAELREQIAAKAQQDAEKYKLDDIDIEALKQLYTGFSQSMLYRDGQEYAVRIEAGEKTEWMGEEEYPPSNLQVKGIEYVSFRNPEIKKLSHINSRGNESYMEQQVTIQPLRASSALLKAVLGEFNRIAVVEGENRQIRKSSERIFRCTALQAPAELSFPANNTQRIKVFAVPIHRVGQFRGY